MDDILNAATKLQWTEETATIEEIEEKFGFPQIVKTTTETSQIYDLPEDETVLLLTQRNPIRLTAQTVEEGHYVMGKQIIIPSEFSGVFKISCDYEREEISLQTFRSIQEVSDAFPPKVYVQEQLTVTLASDDNSGKFITVVLEKGDELTVINRLESQAGLGIISKPASRFISRVRRLQQNYLAVHCTRLNESLSLPMSIQGWFATRPPLFVHLMERKGIISLQQIMEQADFPLTVTVSTNSTRSCKDEFVLRSGMRLKLLGLEEHSLVLAIAPFQKIIEFSSSSVSFKLPVVLTNINNMEKDQVAARNQYQTYVQSAFMQSRLQNSPSNIEEYCTAVRFHVPRNRNPTSPKPLNSNAYLRNLTLSAQQQRRPSPSTHGISAIQLLTSQPAEGMLQRDKRMSRRQSGSLRRHLPTPDTPPASSPVSGSNPPLPPRNSPLPATPNHYGNAPVANNLEQTFAPPVPPKNRAPPPPSYEPPSLASAIKGSPSHTVEMPSRQAPSIPNSGIATSHTTNGYDQSEEESIFEEFVPRVPLVTSSSHDNLRTAFTSNETVLSSPFSVDSNNTKSSAMLDQITIPSSSSLVQDQSRSDSPCFVLQPTPVAAETPLSNNYQNHSPSFSRDSTAVEKSCFSAASFRTSEASKSSPASSEVLERSSTDPSDQSNSSARGSMTFHVNGIESESELSGEARSSNEIRCESAVPLPKEYVSAPNNWHPPSDVSSMNVDEVTKSLRYIGIHEKVVQSFRNEMIDGYLLVELTDDILEDDFLLSKLHRFKLRRFLQGWRPKLPSA